MRASRPSRHQPARHPVAAFAAHALAVTLAACGTESAEQGTAEKTAPPPATASMDPCALLEAGEIQATLAWTPDSARGSGYGTTGTCNHFGPKGMMQQVTVVVGQGMSDMSSSAAMAAWRKEQYKGYDAGAIVEPVEGLGVPAIRNEIAGLVTIEMAVKGKLVSVGAMSSLEDVKALAALVIPRVK